jgi:hypothetical protein
VETAAVRDLEYIQRLSLSQENAVLWNFVDFVYLAQLTHWKNWQERIFAAVHAEALAKAFDLLKVAVDAADEVVYAAFIDLGHKIHPANNPGKKEVSKPFNELLNAYALIRKSRQGRLFQLAA